MKFLVFTERQTFTAIPDHDFENVLIRNINLFVVPLNFNVMEESVENMVTRFLPISFNAGGNRSEFKISPNKMLLSSEQFPRATYVTVLKILKVWRTTADGN